MKKILVLLAFLFATSASADTVKSLTWNPATNKLNALTGQSGTKPVAAYGTPFVYNFANWNPSATGGPFNTASTCANNTVAVASELVSQTCSAGAVTFTLNRAGIYLIQVNFRHQHGGSYTQWQTFSQITAGTATLLGQLNTTNAVERVDDACNCDSMGNLKSFMVQATAAGQTFTYKPSVTTTIPGTNTVHNSIMTLFITPL